MTCVSKLGERGGGRREREGERNKGKEKERERERERKRFILPSAIHSARALPYPPAFAMPFEFMPAATK